MIMKTKIRFAVLGCSRIAKKAAIPALLDSQYAELAMVGSRSYEHAKECAAEFGCDSYGTYEEVLGSKDVDAVYISLPNSLHEEWAVKAAEAGRHVWCEKPAALTYASAKKMVAASKKNNVRLMEGFMFLSHPQHAKVREMIEKGMIGELRTFEAEYSYPLPDTDNIRLDADLGGGIYYDAAVYPIRASKMFFNAEPESIVCNLTMGTESGVDIKAEGVLTYPDGRSASFSSAFSDEYRSTYTIVGSKAQIRMERAYAVPKDMAVKIFLEAAGGVQEIVIPPADHFKLMLDEFCKEILLGSAGTKHYEEDLLAQARVLEAGRLSHTEHRTVPLSEIV
jgi:predicted dehydrogenase